MIASLRERTIVSYIKGISEDSGLPGKVPKEVGQVIWQGRILHKSHGLFGLFDLRNSNNPVAQAKKIF